MHSPTRSERSSGFLSQETGTDTFSSNHAKFQQFFFFFFLSSIPLARASFSLVNLRNVVPLIVSGVFTQTLLHGYFRQTGFVHTSTCTPRTAWRPPHKADEFSPATLCSACENRVTKLRKPIFACRNLACKPPQNARVRATLPFSNGTPPNQLRTNWIGIKWRTWSRLDRPASATRGYNIIYTYNFSPQI